MNEGMLKTNELCKELRVTRAAISLWVKQGMPTVIKKPMRFDLVEVKKWLNKRG